tara:strand:+ start:165 stop:824 length:660 start_codon:yes stop_codon:yes gene_type:complete
MTETYEIARKNMVINQLRPNKINEEKLLKIFEDIPKEDYLNKDLLDNCYVDMNLNITSNRGYLKNLHLAQILKYSNVKLSDKVLHIGGLTGYFSVLLSRICYKVIAIEENNKLFDTLKTNIEKNSIDNVTLINNKLLDGFESDAPYDLIIIDGPIFELNSQLKKQLSNNGGRLVYIKKINNELSKAYKIVKNKDLYSSEYLFDVMCNFEIQKKEEVFIF